MFVSNTPFLFAYANRKQYRNNLALPVSFHERDASMEVVFETNTTYPGSANLFHHNLHDFMQAARGVFNLQDFFFRFANQLALRVHADKHNPRMGFNTRR